MARWGGVAWLAFSIPGAVLLLVAVGGYETLRRRGRPGPTLSSTYVNEITAMFYGSKRAELDHRDSWSMMRQEDGEGAPPLDIDLDHGVARLPDEPT